MKFKLKTPFKPAGDQPQAIEKLVQGIEKNLRYQTLLGVTGSGKTYTVANVIERIQKPTLVIAHNKTLAAQLCNEFREFFPENAVEYFVSYYDYYQPEAYIPHSDTYIEKEAQINDEIDRLRHAATQALLTRRDVIVVASVSCIYNIGSPEVYESEVIFVRKNAPFDRSKTLRKFVNLGYTRTTGSVERSTFRTHGEIIDIMPSSGEVVYRLELHEQNLSRIVSLEPLTNKIQKEHDDLWIFPARHFVTPLSQKEAALKAIREELKIRLKYLHDQGLLLEEERLERRTNFDLEMIQEIGYCSGIENYSRHFDGRAPGQPAHTLISYFPADYLMVIDESHVTLPQLHGMHNGDRARKKALIDNGFRLESAYDNRPLTFDEFTARVNQCIFTSATPADYERKISAQIVEQIIRPTGLVDPEVEIRPIMDKELGTRDQGTGIREQGSKIKNQVEDVIEEIKVRTQKNERTMVTTLTKKQAEDLTEYLEKQHIKAKYLHSDIETLDRIRILTAFRKGIFDCLVGVNLLREGLDLPEVTLVAILDADKEGFLRSETSLIQTIGRAARNVQGKVILYADDMTGSIMRAVSETNRRREKQLAHNTAHGITPQTIQKQIHDITKIWGMKEKDIEEILNIELKPKRKGARMSKSDRENIIREKERQMREAAKSLEFELAAVLRDEIKVLRKKV